MSTDLRGLISFLVSIVITTSLSAQRPTPHLRNLNVPVSISKLLIEDNRQGVDNKNLLVTLQNSDEFDTFSLNPPLEKKTVRGINKTVNSNLSRNALVECKELIIQIRKCDLGFSGGYYYQLDSIKVDIGVSCVTVDTTYHSGGRQIRILTSKENNPVVIRGLRDIAIFNRTKVDSPSSLT